MKKTILGVLTCLLICFTSCEKNNSGEESISKLTPNEHKAQIEAAGNAFINSINVADYQAITTSLMTFVDLIQSTNLMDVLLPQNPGPQQQEKVTKSLINTVTSITSVITRNDIQSLTRLATAPEMDLATMVAMVAGIYTFDGTATWTKVPATDTIEFIYGTSVFAITISDLTNIQGNIAITLKVDEKEELNLTIGITGSEDMKTMGATINLALSANYKWNAKIDMNGTAGSLTYSMTAKDAQIMAATATITGTNMTTIPAPLPTVPLPPAPASTNNASDPEFHNTTFNFQVMNLELKGNSNMAAIETAMKALKSPELDASDAVKKEYCEKSSQINNDNTALAIYYSDKDEKIATIKYKADFRTDNVNDVTNEEWTNSPVLVFASDNSEVFFDDYFTKANFGSLDKAITELMNEFYEMLGMTPLVPAQ